MSHPRIRALVAALSFAIALSGLPHVAHAQAPAAPLVPHTVSVALHGCTAAITVSAGTGTGDVWIEEDARGGVVWPTTAPSSAGPGWPTVEVAPAGLAVDVPMEQLGNFSVGYLLQGAPFTEITLTTIDMGVTEQDPIWGLPCTASPFVQAAYQDFIGAPPTAADLTVDSLALQDGTMTKTEFLTAMANSDEWLNAIVTKMYADTLGRAPDAAGLAGWTTLIRNKTFTVADVASRFYSSDEYYLYHAGGTPTSWVTTLYTKLLNRAPDAAGLAAWVTATTSPSYGRDKVAYGFYQSPESRMHRVLDLYQALLKRNPDPTGWPYWTTQVLTTGDITLAINLANSQEYQLIAETRF
ncbi:MAG TPA: DUF4214 domain-containing protein [Propionibacteriaceae bacterium]|jgi:hypothetical protein